MTGIQVNLVVINFFIIIGNRMSSIHQATNYVVTTSLPLYIVPAHYV